MDHPPEQVLVIETPLANALAPQIFNLVQIDIEKQIVAAHSFRDREEAETNLGFKQVIPYVVVSHAGRYLLTQRTDKQQEKRLHNMFSIGQGGHISSLDLDAQYPDPIRAGRQREIAEEFLLSAAMECSPIGIINDNSTEVGQVHLGLVYLMSVSAEEFEVAETGKHIARWANVKVLQEHFDRMENWSKILMTYWLCVGTA